MAKGVAPVRRSRKASVRYWLLGLIAIGVTLLMLSGSVYASSTSPLRSTGRYSPPYPGGTITFDFVQEYGCGSNVFHSVAPSFNLTSGVGVFDQRVSAWDKCHEMVSHTLVTAGFGTGNTLSITAKRTYEFVANWTLNFTVRLTAHNGTYHTGSPTACFNVAIVIGVANGIWERTHDGPAVALCVTNSTYQRTYVDLPLSCAYSVRLPGTLTRWHVETFVQVLMTTVATAGSDKASAEINLATDGQGATLDYYSYARL
jgi:hypothetical protein